MAMRPEKEEIMKIGFIGCGNMASAMIGGILKKQVASPEEILASARTEASRRKAEEAFGIAVTEDNRRVAAFADLLILAVKPFYYQEVIAEIKDSVGGSGGGGLLLGVGSGGMELACVGLACGWCAAMPASCGGGE